MGLLKMDMNYNKLDSIHFGKLIDTVDYPGFHNNLSFISKENIFLAVRQTLIYTILYFQHCNPPIF